MKRADWTRSWRGRLVRLLGIGAVLLLAIRPTMPGVSAAQGPLADTPWPAYGQNVQRTNRSPFQGPQNLPTVKWSFNRANDHWGTDYRGTGVGQNNTVYLAAGMAGVYAIDSTNGARRWLFSPPSTGHETWVEFPPAVAADGNLYFTSENDYAYALDPNGNVLWSFLSDHLHTPMSISPDGSRVHFVSESGHIYALNRSNGAQVWRYQLGPFRVYATGRRIPIVYDAAGNLYFAWIHTIWSLTPDGTKRWSLNLPGRNSGSYSVGPAIAPDGTLYFVRSDALTAVNPNGTLKWEQILGRPAFDRTPTIGADGTVYIGAEDGFLYAFNPNGTLKWKQQYVTVTGWGAGIKSNVLLDAAGMLYFLGRDGFVYGVDSQTRQVRWRYATGQIDQSYPGIQLSLDADGTLYVPVDERLMLALAAGSGSGGTPTQTPTQTPTATSSVSPTTTNTPTSTATSTSTPTPSRTPTQTPTSTATPTQIPPPTGNLLTNAGFEADANGDNLPDSWSLSPGASSFVTRSSAVTFEGAHALLARFGTVAGGVSGHPGQAR